MKLEARKKRNAYRNKKQQPNPRITYLFDIEKCKCCPYRDGCYKEGAKSKTYTETLITGIHKEQAAFQETPFFQEKSSGLGGMQIQGAMTLFAVNLKRILTLID